VSEKKIVCEHGRDCHKTPPNFLPCPTSISSSLAPLNFIPFQTYSLFVSLANYSNSTVLLILKKNTFTKSAPISAMSIFRTSDCDSSRFTNCVALIVLARIVLGLFNAAIALIAPADSCPAAQFSWCAALQDFRSVGSFACGALVSLIATAPGEGEGEDEAAWEDDCLHWLSSSRRVLKHLHISTTQMLKTDLGWSLQLIACLW